MTIQHFAAGREKCARLALSTFFRLYAIREVGSGLVADMHSSDATTSEVPRSTVAPADLGASQATTAAPQDAPPVVSPVKTAAREKALKIAQDELVRRGDTGSRFKRWEKDGAMRFGCDGRRECLASDHVHDRRMKLVKKTGNMAMRSGQDFLLRVAPNGDLVFICLKEECRKFGQRMVPLLRMPDELRDL